MRGEKLYPSLILGGFNGEVVHLIYPYRSLKQIKDMLKDVFERNPVVTVLIFHRNQGW
ncbi:hypothetical protein M2475_000453 [Breznakia sp. PF5-3]|uniref:hypothetical protein n=1 Tax=unclassified Breznakia TaxID=2623764 RepID=UPI00240526FE|nr:MULTISPECIES: hypothetical protein [unclassified Breznakia]MDF9824033.1 hypothetical protein [Breznakia sp. PM6-1]MDF9834901.1 hypothetical protein [Breznakia sp. PF5-3]MDF9837077.1 hypothetical protein [Breznakia sp. PFB2-8]MDF9859002.1 hypothetical protein [Breznakia sp. PH5-24]